MSEREDWTKLGATSPHWAVCKDDRFRANHLDAAALKAFFESGEQDVAATLALVRHVAPALGRPKRALDYGCGVARLTMPLARECDTVIGIDVSEPMLAEAKRNCAERGLENVEFYLAHQLESVATPNRLDFVHSYIVFQHIPPSEGLRITALLVNALRPGGVGALHYTYFRRASLIRRLVNPLRRRFRLFDIAVRIVRGEPPLEPGIPMYEYDIGAILELLQRHGYSRLSMSLTDHGGHLGAMIVFQSS